MARWNTFRRVLFTEERDRPKLKLMLFMTRADLGVAVRLVSSAYHFADLSIEGAFLMVFWVDALSGWERRVTIASAASALSGLDAAARLQTCGWMMSASDPNKEHLWNFGPFTFLNIQKRW